MKKIYTVLILLVMAMPAFAGELFPGGKPDTSAKGAVLQSASTIGGYAIYPGEGAWLVADLQTQQTDSLGQAQAVQIGTAQLVQTGPDGQWAASMWITANLHNVGTNQFLTGSPCAGKHLIALNKVRAQDDNCLTVDAQMETLGGRQVMVFIVRVTQAMSAGRIYQMALVLNSEALGLRDTSPAQFGPDALQSAPDRKAFMERMQKWAQALQGASSRVIDFNKPQDAFEKVPSYKTLAMLAGGP